jgi:acyl-CoA thioester hydrolase
MDRSSRGAVGRNEATTGRLDSSTRARYGVGEDWAFGIERRVAWSELDPFGHANNISYLVYFEDARNAYLELCGLAPLSASTPGPVLVESRQEYLRPLAYGDEVLVTARTTALGHSSLRQEYAVWRDGLVARGSIAAVLMINATGEKVAIPDGLRVAIAALEHAPVADSRSGSA